MSLNHRFRPCQHRARRIRRPRTGTGRLDLRTLGDGKRSGVAEKKRSRSSRSLTTSSTKSSSRVSQPPKSKPHTSPQKYHKSSHESKESPEDSNIFKPPKAPSTQVESFSSKELVTKDKEPSPEEVSAFWRDQLAPTDPFKNAKVILTFQSGLQAKSVELLQGNVVRKQYTSRRLHFCRREVEAMRKLRASGIVPQLLWAHPLKPYFYMTYCGPDLTSVDELVQHRVEIDELAARLLREYGVYHNDIKPSNVCYNDQEGRLYLIDLGWCHDRPYKVEEGNRSGYNCVEDYVEHKRQKRLLKAKRRLYRHLT